MSWHADVHGVQAMLPLEDQNLSLQLASVIYSPATSSC